MSDREKTVRALNHILAAISSVFEKKVEPITGGVDGVEKMAKNMFKQVDDWLSSANGLSLDFESTSRAVEQFNDLLNQRIRDMRQQDFVTWTHESTPKQLPGHEMAVMLTDAMRVFASELEILTHCADCVLNYYLNTTCADFFAKCCPRPHVAVWAKYLDYQYWPAKVMGIKRTHPTDGSSSSGTSAFVWFFGPKKETAEVPLTRIRFLSQSANNKWGFPRGGSSFQQLMQQDHNFSAAVFSLKKYILNWTDSSVGHRIIFFKPASHNKFDGSLLFSMAEDSDCDTEASDSDSSDLSSFRDILFSTRNVTSVPKKYLHSVLNDSRWIQKIVICSIPHSSPRVNHPTSETGCPEQQSVVDCSGMDDDFDVDTEVEDETELEDNDPTEVEVMESDDSDEYTDMEDEESEEPSDQTRVMDYTHLLHVLKTCVKSVVENEKKRLLRDFDAKMAVIEAQTRQLEEELAQESGETDAGPA